MEGKFCVVGGDGFYGSSLVNSLLNRGFSVHATILPTSGNEDIHYLQRLPGAHEKLKLFNADLRVEGSFDSPISGCQGVFLVASPVGFGSKDPAVKTETEFIFHFNPEQNDIGWGFLLLQRVHEQNEVVEVAVQGPINVLKSCVKAKTVKRIVFTSSCCAMSPVNEQGEMNNNSSSVESFWTSVNHVRSNKQQFPIWPYFVSKTLAEQAAWNFASENNLDLVTIGPSVTGGLFITHYIPISNQILLWFLQGNNGDPSSGIRSIVSLFGTFPVVHVSDVCDAHIFLMEQPAAQGRYLCTADTLSVKELHQFLNKRYPELKLTDMLQDLDSRIPKNTQYKSAKLTDLGFIFKHGIDEIYNDCIESYKKLGLLTAK